MLHAADIDPSEDDRETIIGFLQLVLKDTENKVKELETTLKKGKIQDTEQIKDLEREKIHHERNAKMIDDALSKCERTSGHTLKKAFNKKLIAAVKSTMSDDKYQNLETVLLNNGLVHQHPVHNASHMHHHVEAH